MGRSLKEKITDGLRLFGLELHDKTVLLKPNLVEYIPGAEVNTNPLLVGAAAAAFLALGAKPLLWRKDPAISGTRISFSLRATLHRINNTMPAHFVIADGIVAMEGNGPLHGTARDLGRIVMSDDPVAADFTCARLMGFDPYRISHLAQAGQFLGNGEVQRIEQLGERLPRSVRPFSVLPEFAHVIAGATNRHSQRGGRRHRHCPH
jgi:uncharacterized protein (DUF362 family)